MNKDEHYNELENGFQKRDSLLQSLTEDNTGDDLHLYPAWSSLHKNEARYCKNRFIAAGGEKTIEAVFDHVSQREVALARPKGDTLPEKERFLKEARVTAYLQHPNIMPVYDIGREDSTPYFTMELIRGENLAARRGSKKLSPQELDDLLVVFIRICDALACAHSKNISHLDIKPANIQLGPFG